MNPSRPRARIIKRDQTDFTFECPDCVREKNSPFHPERASFKRGPIEEEDIYFKGTLPLGQESGTFACDRGHQHLVVRERLPN